MTNTLILNVSCVYFLSSFSLFFCVSSYGLGTYIGHPTAQRSHVDCNQLHSRKMPASSDSTHDCFSAARIVGRVTYSLPLGRSISPPLREMAIGFSSGSRGGGGRGDARPPVPAKKKKKKKKKKKGKNECFWTRALISECSASPEAAAGSPPWQPRPWSVLTRPWDSSSQTTAARCLRGAWMHCCACMSTRTYNWILKKWWRHTGINIQEECCWVDRWMHDFLHVEHLLLDLPDLPSDFKYCVNIVNICTNYLANSLSDFSEIIPQNSEKCISAHRNFQNFPGEHAPGPP